VNDPPFITSIPTTNAMAGVGYVYTLTAIDGDNDALTYSLPQKPENMTITDSGKIIWFPSQGGIYPMSVAVDDGQAIVYQNFSIHVTPNNPPRFMSTPVMKAIMGVQYFYDAQAIDDDNDILTFSLVNKPEGMSIGSSMGRIAWTPTASQIGNNTITVKVTDGRGGDAEQTFFIKVIYSVRPKCAITSPANGTKVKGNILIHGTATNGEASIVSIQVRVDGGNWLDAKGTDNWTFQVDTTGLANGPRTFGAKAFDGGNYSDPASVTLVVDNPKPHLSSGNGIWWFPPSVVLVMAAVAGLLFWKARRSGKPKQ
jgi:hypothetical protein